MTVRHQVAFIRVVKKTYGSRGKNSMLKASILGKQASAAKSAYGGSGREPGSRDCLSVTAFIKERQSNFWRDLNH